jgi:hypothetical protein
LKGVPSAAQANKLRPSRVRWGYGDSAQKAATTGATSAGTYAVLLAVALSVLWP